MNPVVRIAVRLALVAAVLVAGLAAATPAHADREFSLRYTANETGSIKGIANTNMTCSTASGATGASTCVDARNAGVTSSVNSANDFRNNNAHTSAYIDVDSDSSTFNSSTANQSLPAGSTILYAALYWGGHYTGASSPANASLRDTVRFKVPGSSAYQTVSASVLDDGVGGNAGRYQAFADVTNLIKNLPNAGNGTYAVGNIQSAIGTDRYAGWSLIVAYKNPAETVKNMSIFDGLISIGLGQSREIPISGFLTPPSGPLNAEIGFVTWEGDLGLNGDQAKLNGHNLGDAQHPTNNFFDSRISHNGTLFTDRNPAFPNSLGMDAAWTTPPAAAITHNMTSAKILVNSVGEQYLPGVITFQVEIFAPRIKQTKTVADDNGGLLEQGDVLTYKIAGKNEGDDGTANFVLRDPIPANTTYVPGSLKIVKNAGAATGNQTDPASDDRAEFDSVNDRVIFRLGQGSNSSVGGNIAPGEQYEVEFKVKVNGPTPNAVPNLTKIENQATATYNSKIAGTPLTSESDADITVKSPDLKITKVRTGADFTVGGTSAYTLSVKNHGSAKTQGQVTVSDPLPAGLTATAVNAPGWTCNPLPASSFTCSRSDSLAAGSSYPDIVLTVAIDDSIADEVENTSTVSGGGDANLGDNTSSSTNPASRVADLAIVKTASQHAVKIGDTFTYQLKVTNNGPSKATSVAISDEIPAGLSFISADPGCAFQPTNGTVVCALGTLANGASKTVNVTVKVDGDAGGQITNVASVTAQQTDPNPGNNTDTEIVDASGADLEVIKTLKSPTSPVKTGDTVVYEIKVKNHGPSAATGVVLYDALPAGLNAVSTNSGGCDVDGGAVTCVIGNLANGASVTVEVTGKVKPGQDELVNTATATGNENDPTPENNTDDVTTPVTKIADLGVEKTANKSIVEPGQNFEFFFKVTNNGPDHVYGATVTDVLPTGLTYVQGAPGCNAVGQTVTCTINHLAPGGFAQTGITVKVAADNDGPIVNVAKVSSNLPDPNPDNDESTVEVPVKKIADVQIIKSVDNNNPKAGDEITYTLTVKNNGPGKAEGVVATDQLPDGVTFVSADAPCTEAGGKVTCEAGTLAAGQVVKYKIKVKVNDWSPVTNTGTHGIDVQKDEVQMDVAGGQTRTLTASCPVGFFVSDGSVRNPQANNSETFVSDVEVLESRSTDRRTWQATVTNRGSVHAQAKIFIVCIRDVTSPDTDGHDLKVTGPVTKIVSIEPGLNEAVLNCPAGSVAIAPGFKSDSPGNLVYSQPEGNGWKFKFKTDVDEHGDKIKFSISCMSKSLVEADGHNHDLNFKRIWDEVTIQPGKVHEVQLTCPDGSKGIVGGWDADDGLVPLGNDPRPVTRAFKIYNPTDKPLKVRYSLLCLGDRTGEGYTQVGPKTIINTADVESTTEDPNLTNNHSEVTIIATKGGDADVPNGNGKPTVNNPTAKPGVTVLSAKVKSGKVTVKVKSSGKTSGVVKVFTVKKLKVNGKRVAKGTVIAKTRYKFGKATNRSIKLKVTGIGRKILNQRKAKRAKVKVPGSAAKVIKIG